MNDGPSTAFSFRYGIAQQVSHPVSLFISDSPVSTFDEGKVAADRCRVLLSKLEHHWHNLPSNPSDG